MPLLLRCVQGHEWYATDPGNGPLTPRHLRCPSCGAAVAKPAGKIDPLAATLPPSLPPGAARATRPPVQTARGGPLPDKTLTTPTSRSLGSMVRPSPATQSPNDFGDTIASPARSPGTAVNPLDATLQRAPATQTTHSIDLGESPSGKGYEIIQMLGRGAMGVVYQARQVSLNRIVALKMILSGAHASPEDRARFRIEGEAVAELQHPNIVQIYEVGEQDGHPFFSLEYLAGGTLQQKIATGLLRPQDAAEIVRILAEAMSYAHQRGIVHRDLKPANILFTAEGTPKITDFGLAKRMDALEQSASGNILGTPSYMAPEQASGRSKTISPATDVYALGAILYDMLTGRPPFQAASVVEALDKVRNQEPMPLRTLQPKLPRDLETICLKCLQKEPAKRYPTASELAEDLQRFLDHKPIQARPVSTWEHGYKWVRRHPSWAALICLTVCLIIGSFAWVVERWQTAEAARLAEIELKKQSRLHDAKMFIRWMGELRALYANAVVSRVRQHGISVSHDYRDHDKAIPIWATFSIELSQKFNNEERGEITRLYSDFPFPWRKNGGPADDFEKEALAKLRQQPDQPFYRFENFQGRPSVRYAAPDRMLASCVACHNAHPASPKTDWKEGDVRGVLEVILPLD